MYTTTDFRTKGELKDTVAAGVKVTVEAPPIGKTPTDGTVFLEGPHFPKPHTWYTKAELKDGLVIKVK